MSKASLAEIFARPALRAGIEELVPVDRIDVLVNRLRPANPDWVALYADDLGAGRKLPAIELRPCHDKPGRYVLVTGLHRLEAHKAAGLSLIAAAVEDMTEAEARLREIDENLHRSDLNALDRALFLAERKRVWEELHPAARHGGDRKSPKKAGENQVADSATCRFTAQAAERIGLSERSIQEAVKLAKAIAPAAIPLIRKTYLADHGADLAKLARLAPDQQLAAVKRITGGTAKTLRDSLTALGRGPAPVDVQERLFQSVVDAWSRMNARSRKRVLAHIQGTGGKGNGEAARQEPQKTHA